MNKKVFQKIAVVLFVVIFAAVSLTATIAKNNLQNASNICANHPNRMWAWTLDGAWMSTNKTGDWKTDNWFYMLKSGEPVIVTQIDGKLGYYLVCYDFGSDTGWQALYGWVQKDNILLQSEITPIP